MWNFFRKFPWVLEPVRYTDQAFDSVANKRDGYTVAPLWSSTRKFR